MAWVGSPCILALNALEASNLLPYTSFWNHQPWYLINYVDEYRESLEHGAWHEVTLGLEKLCQNEDLQDLLGDIAMGLMPHYLECKDEVHCLEVANDG